MFMTNNNDRTKERNRPICMYHIFIHSVIYGELNCFCILVRVNSVAVNKKMQMFLQTLISFPLDITHKWDCWIMW